MTITGAVVLFAVIWFVSLLVALPIGIRTQEEAGKVTPGTPSSAPENPRVGRKMLWVTVVTLVLWLPLCAFILWGGVTVRDLDFWHRMG
jgi:predicted secreted protein